MAKKRNTAHEFIQSVIDKYKPILQLTDTDFNIVKTDETEFAACKLVYPYKITEIQYSSRFERAYDKKEKKDSYFERVIIHEMVHQLTDPLYVKSTRRFIVQEDIEDERELLTDKIASIIHKLQISKTT